MVLRIRQREHAETWKGRTSRLQSLKVRWVRVSEAKEPLWKAQGWMASRLLRMLVPLMTRLRSDSSSPSTGDTAIVLHPTKHSSLSRVQLSISTGTNFCDVVLLHIAAAHDSAPVRATCALAHTWQHL
jgi:hypothetical protein